MADVVDKHTRSKMMSGIRSCNTKPEVITRRALHKLGFRYNLDSKVGKIKPDIVLRCYKVAIFVHGCYWHKHQGCKLAYSDRRYSAKWKTKFVDNKRRDQHVQEQLLSEGWRVAVIWECVTRNNSEFRNEIKKLSKFVLAEKPKYFETTFHEKIM